ncbi:MAG: rhomboid family intramembrane serine protease, partial [Acidimicrobiia bacterium]|nr:rhomboid family intramembrane serine protease [Acidimicrobiia bacterium]
LYILGQGLEGRLGRLRFGAVWLFSGVAGGVAVTYLADPLSGTVGASGAVFGLFGIWLGSAWVQRGSRAGNAQLRSILSLLAINAFISLLPGISWQGHLGGLLGGVFAYAILRTVKDRSAAAMLLLGLSGILVFATQL